MMLFHKQESRFIWDASAWIGLWNETRFSEFPQLLLQLENLVHQSIIVSPPIVIDEIIGHGDALSKWVAVRRGPLEEILGPSEQGKVQDKVKALTNVYQMKTRTGADYYVIAWGEILGEQFGLKNISVVSQERETGKLDNIPEVCKAMNIRHYSLQGFIEFQKWEIPQ